MTRLSPRLTHQRKRVKATSLHKIFTECQQASVAVRQFYRQNETRIPLCQSSFRDRYRMFVKGKQENDQEKVRKALTDRRGEFKRAFTVAEEENLAQSIRAQISEEKAPVTKETVAVAAERFFHELHPRNTRSSRVFKASRGFVEGLKARQNFRSKLPKLKRRTAGASAVAWKSDRENFLQEVKNAKLEFGDHLVFNLDETPCAVVEKPLKGWAFAKERPIISSSGQLYRNVTVIVAAALDGHKFPLGIVSKGKTNEGLENMNFPPDFSSISRLLAYSTESGWINDQILIDYIAHAFLPYLDRFSYDSEADYRAALVIDDYRAHWTDEVVDFCDEHGILLIKVPPGQTDETQPLDISVMGPLHQIRGRMWRESRLSSSVEEDSVEQAIIRSVRSWDELSSDLILKGWKQLAEL